MKRPRRLRVRSLAQGADDDLEKLQKKAERGRRKSQLEERSLIEN